MLTEAEYSDPMDNWDYDGFSVICPPNSEIRKLPGFDSRKDNWIAGNDSFIQDHAESMNLCSNPEQQPIHGFTGW